MNDKEFDNQQDDIQVVSSPIREHTIETLSEYWTDEAMANAIPIEATLSTEELLAQPSPEPWEISGYQMTMETQPPDSEDIVDHQAALQTVPTPQVGFNTSLVTNRNTPPYATVGKMFMTFNGRNYVGTGWVVAEKAVFTAGHCVYDRNNGGWADNILFIPRYHNGNAPVGRWTSIQIHSLSGWTTNGKFEYDMGVFVVDRLIRPSTGSLGWMANYPPNQGPYDSIGYPARVIPGFNFNGQNMWHSQGAYINGTKIIQMHNNMTGGCSGGPWVVSKNGMVYSNGLNSYRYTSQPNTMYSPYFGNGFINLYNVVKNVR